MLPTVDLALLPKMPKQSLAPIETGVKGEQRHTLKRSGRIEPGRQESLERTELHFSLHRGNWGSEGMGEQSQGREN